MTYSADDLDYVFKKTSGQCHLCHKPLTRTAYGSLDHAQSWEVDHSKPRAEDGTDHRNNLYPAHVSCNRAKGKRSSGEIRAKNGVAGTPMSPEEVERAKNDNMAAGAIAGGVGAAAIIAGMELGAEFGLLAGPPGVLIGGLLGAVIGGLIGNSIDPKKK